jgi:hypothetical protein
MTISFQQFVTLSMFVVAAMWAMATYYFFKSKRLERAAVEMKDACSRLAAVAKRREEIADQYAVLMDEYEAKQALGVYCPSCKYARERTSAFPRLRRLRRRS